MEASGFMKRSRHRFNFESRLTEEQKESFKQLFTIYDKDGSCTIDVAFILLDFSTDVVLQIMELNNVLVQLGYSFSPENLDIIIHIVDDNMDGILNFQEFLGLYDFLEYLKVGDFQA